MINNVDKVSCVYIFCLTKLVIFSPHNFDINQKKTMWDEPNVDKIFFLFYLVKHEEIAKER